MQVAGEPERLATGRNVESRGFAAGGRGRELLASLSRSFVPPVYQICIIAIDVWTASGTSADRRDSGTRDRLLVAATQLLDEAAGGPVSTREITERAGVRAPTLYHHFGSKQALLDAVVSHGFTEFLRSRSAGSNNSGPLEDIRAGWDSHVAFGLEFPGAYAHIYGNVKPGVPCGVTEDVRAHLLEALQPAAIQRRLRVTPAEAATRILAACSGITLTLIQQPATERDLGLSEGMRESVLASIIEGPMEMAALHTPGARQALESVAATIDDANTLTTGERMLMRELLARLADDY
jgi:AcrR family transcriptional regulator